MACVDLSWYSVSVQSVKMVFSIECEYAAVCIQCLKSSRFPYCTAIPFSNLGCVPHVFHFCCALVVLVFMVYF